MVPSHPIPSTCRDNSELGKRLNFCPVPAAAVVSVADGSSEVGGVE